MRKNIGNIAITDVRALPGDSAFLLDDGRTAVLCDTGFGFTGYRVAENIAKALGSRTLDYILLTHSHYDHALGSAYVTKVFPGAKVVAGAYAAKIFQKPSARETMRELDRKAARGQGIAAYEDRADALRVDIAVNDGDALRCGDMHFTVIALPGHTRCSVGYYLAQEQLLLGVETLGVCFEKDTYLPSCLVGYKMTLEAFHKANNLPVQRILVPHYGVVEGESAREYLRKGERDTVQMAAQICERLQKGETTEAIAAYLTEKYYLPHVRPSYPLDAFQLNIRIMIDLIRRELLPETSAQSF